ncbi:nitroreductase family protein [Ralstonia syzygii]|uniref:Putative nitroreductase n=1 Tax=Ralstonia syzygii R24 TaxID=907261 RepID=G3A3I9_9RALS|nr:nitroreductase family protein [Ralstonia syzygii]CCA88437.1 putative nitroreductase [Ralstonia syzygii R24]
MHERIADHPIDPLFLARWSPRAYDARPMPQADLLCLLEAARWAPSAYNCQPWRFLYARRDDAHWADFLGLLVTANGDWAQHAAALVFVLSDTLLDPDGAADAMPMPVPLRSHSFDAGAAWAQLALQAVRLGYHARAMAGVEYERARAVLNVPERFHIEIAVAVGRRGTTASLPVPLQPHERPTQRRTLDELAFGGPFPA